MGNIHSTRWKNYKPKGLVEEYPSIDAGEIKEEVKLGNIYFDNDEMNEEENENLIAYYEKLGFEVSIDKMPQNFGGYRWWYKCPKCINRVKKLYLINGSFKCRKCHNLTYRSCRESHTKSPAEKLSYFYKKYLGKPMPKSDKRSFNILLANGPLNYLTS